MTELRLDRSIGQAGSPLRYGIVGISLPFLVGWALLSNTTADRDASAWTLIGVFLYVSATYAIHLRVTLRAPTPAGTRPAGAPAPVLTTNPLFANNYAAAWRSLQDAPTCRWEAEQAAQELYRLGGLHPPELTVWARSPREALLMERLLRLFYRRMRVRGDAPAVAWGRVTRLPIKPGTRLWAARARLDAEVSRRLRTRFGRPFSGALDGSRVDLLLARDTGLRPAASTLLEVAATQATNMEAAIGETLRHELGRRVMPNPLGLSRARDRFVYAYERGWSSLATASEQVRARHLVRLGLAASGWRALSGAVVLIERPVVCCWSSGGQLQAIDGPALVWPDGWEVFAWDGQAVTREIVMSPERLDLPSIRGMATGMRRIAVTRYGEERYRAEASASLELVRAEPDPQIRRSLVTRSTKRSATGPKRRCASSSSGPSPIRGCARSSSRATAPSVTARRSRRAWS